MLCAHVCRSGENPWKLVLSFHHADPRAWPWLISLGDRCLSLPSHLAGMTTGFFLRYIRFLRLQQQSTTHQVAKLLSHGSGGGRSETRASQGWLLLRVWEKLPMLQPLLWWLTASLPCLICGASLALNLHLHDILLGCPSQCFCSLSLWGYQSACIREHSNGLFLNWGSLHLNSK